MIMLELEIESGDEQAQFYLSVLCKRFDQMESVTDLTPMECSSEIWKNCLENLKNGFLII